MGILSSNEKGILCHLIVRVLLLGVLLVVLAASAHATTYRFTNAEPNSDAWSSADNWSPAGGPPSTETDIATFNWSGEAGTLYGNVGPISSLRLGDNSPGSLTIANGARLVVNDGSWNAVGYNNTGRLIIEDGGELIAYNYTAVGMFDKNSEDRMEFYLNGTLEVDALFALGLYFNGLDKDGFPINNLMAIAVINGLLDVKNMSIDEENCLLDLRQGTIIISGNRLGKVATWEGDGRIVAYGGYGTLTSDYDVTNAGRTTITATSPAGQNQPVLTTAAVADITDNSATGHGSISDLGIPNPTNHGVCYSTSPNPTSPCTNEGLAVTTGSFSSSIPSLLPNTTYYVRAYASNAFFTIYGSEVSFTTDPVAPSVITATVTDITGTTATGRGEITDLGVPVPTSHGVCYSTSPNPTAPCTNEGLVVTSGSFSSAIFGLMPNTTYYVRTYASNAFFTIYGSEMSFTTDPVAPTVTTQAASGVGINSATLNAEVNGQNSSTIGIFEYGLSAEYGSTVTADQNPVAGYTNTSVSKTISGLLSNATYHFRVVGHNDAGISSGNNMFFTTKGVLPTVITQNINSIQGNSAIGGGEVIDQGSDEVTARGVCWSESPAPTTNDSCTIDDSGPGAFQSLISNLSTNTSYYVRAYATNTLGTSYGPEQTFQSRMYFYIRVIPTIHSKPQ